MFDQLTYDWHGKTVILIAGGPSLRDFDFAHITPLLRRGAISVAVNDSLVKCHWADVVITIDSIWIGKRSQLLRKFTGEKILCVDETRAKFQSGIRYIRRDSSSRLSDNMGVICTGGNSGFAALGMAMMRGAGTEGGKILMLGYDMNGPGHFHDGYEWKSRYGAKDYPRWARGFGSLALEATDLGIRVINCNSKSAIRCFPFGKIVRGEVKTMELVQ